MMAKKLRHNSRSLLDSYITLIKCLALFDLAQQWLNALFWMLNTQEEKRLEQKRSGNFIH